MPKAPPLVSGKHSAAAAALRQLMLDDPGAISRSIAEYNSQLSFFNPQLNQQQMTHEKYNRQCLPTFSAPFGLLGLGGKI